MNNVLIDCERTKYPNTGLYHFCLSLGNALLKQQNKLLEEFYFYVPPINPVLFGKDQHYIIQHPLHKFFQTGTDKFQVWHSTYQNSSYKPYNRKTGIVLTIHDLNFLIERKAEPDKIKKYLALVQKNVDRADYIVSISDFTRQMMLDNLSLNGKPVEVIYNGCNINEFPGFDNPVYKPARQFIFGLGTVLAKKNFHVLPCLLKNNDYELVIAGIIKKDYEEKIFEEAKLQGVESRVKLTGPVSEEDKYWYYKNCIAFAFPSLAEGFGFPLVEAMYYGKPAFISRLTCLPEIGGDAAYYFNSFDAADMQQVFEKGMQHYATNNPAAAIHARALQFSWANAASAYLSAYRTLYNK
ncbi:MAG: glycosyltransferase family 1 protein [Chitinophagaceae bacterium]